MGIFNIIDTSLAICYSKDMMDTERTHSDFFSWERSVIPPDSTRENLLPEATISQRTVEALNTLATDELNRRSGMVRETLIEAFSQRRWDELISVAQEILNEQEFQMLNRELNAASLEELLELFAQLRLVGCVRKDFTRYSDEMKFRLKPEHILSEMSSEGGKAPISLPCHQKRLGRH
jgi:hypothetical protein